MIKCNELVVTPKSSLRKWGASRAVFLAAVLEHWIENGVPIWKEDEVRLWTSASEEELTSVVPWITLSTSRTHMTHFYRIGLFLQTVRGSMDGRGRRPSLMSVDMDALRDMDDRLWDEWVLQHSAAIETAKFQREEATRGE